MKYGVVAVNKDTHEVESIGHTIDRKSAETYLWVTVRDEQGVKERHLKAIKEQGYADTPRYRYQIVEFL